MKTSELTGAALDWAVAKCERVVGGDDLDVGFILERGYAPSTNWAQGGAIIERELIDVLTVEGGTDGWQADKYLPDEMVAAYGETPLIAAMRCFVASKLGDTIDIPEDLA